MPPKSPMPLERESPSDRIARLNREIARAEGQTYLGDPIKHPKTGKVVVKACGSPQPDPWGYVVDAKQARRESSMDNNNKPKPPRLSESARQLARLGMPLGDDKFEKKSEQRAAFAGRGFSPERSVGDLLDNDKRLNKEWAYIQAIQPKMR